MVKPELPGQERATPVSIRAPGGIITRSITWSTPFVAMMSARITRAPSICSPPPVRTVTGSGISERVATEDSPARSDESRRP